jgi:hypothetical protein
MKKFLFIVLALFGIAGAAHAQQPAQALVVSSCGSASYVAATYGILTMDTTGKLCNGSSGGGGGSVTQGTSPWVVGAPAAAARNFPGCTVGISSAQCLAAATATQFVQIQNTSASATVACAWGVVAVLNSKTAVQLAAGQSASWGINTGGVPNEALNCIASGASTPLYLEWN